jgi:hypothetical protein
MTLNEIQQAERHSRTRASLMAAMAAILAVNAFIGFGEGASGMSPMLRHGLWGLMVALWLVILATGGGLRLSRNVRSLMNDEVALANRSRALQAGFWTATIGGVALYYASLEWELTVREGLRILIHATIAVALIRYARLELK